MLKAGSGSVVRVLGDPGFRTSREESPKTLKVVTDGPMPVGRLYLEWDGLSNRI